jgi:hypothetical protein
VRKQIGWKRIRTDGENRGDRGSTPRAERSTRTGRLPGEEAW